MAPARRLSIAVTPVYDEVFRRFAAERHGGNLAAAFRALIASNSVTKSMLALSGEAT